MARERTLLERLQKAWWFAWIVAIVLALSQLKDATDGLDKILVFIKVKPDALSLAQATEKGEFSRGLTEVAWKRLFWARSFRARIEKQAPQTEIDEAWKAYITATEVWSSRIMVYIVTTEKHYGSEKSIELEGKIQTTVAQMGDSLVALRYATAATPPLLNDAKDKIDEANRALYKFVRGFDQKQA